MKQKAFKKLWSQFYVDQLLLGIGPAWHVVDKAIDTPLEKTKDSFKKFYGSLL